MTYRTTRVAPVAVISVFSGTTEATMAAAAPTNRVAGSGVFRVGCTQLRRLLIGSG